MATISANHAYWQAFNAGWLTPEDIGASVVTFTLRAPDGSTFNQRFRAGETPRKLNSSDVAEIDNPVTHVAVRYS